jgi:hypothetical protein
MNDLKPSKTAYKVALNILTLGEKPEMAGILPPVLLMPQRNCSSPPVQSVRGPYAAPVPLG